MQTVSILNVDCEYIKLFGIEFIWPEMEFKEFEPRFKSAKTRFKFSAGLHLETFDTILSGTAAQIL